MTMEIPLTQGQVALVDDWWYECVSQYNWSAHFDPSSRKFYAHSWVKGKIISLHQFIMSPLPGEIIDHIDRNGGLNCQEHNMRRTTHTGNARNASKRNDNTSGFKGVSFHKASGKYRAYICVDRVIHHIGLFCTAEEAARGYDAKACELHGEFAVLNFPDEWHWNIELSRWESMSQIGG